MSEMDQPRDDRPVIFWFRLILQLGLIIAGAVLLITRPQLMQLIRQNEIDAFWLLVPPIIFLAFFVLYVCIEFFAKKTSPRALVDYIQLGFGIAIIVLSFPSSLREYNVRRLPEAASIELIEKFANNKDASLRALAILALSRHNLNNKSVGALIHQGLLDKDPLVQQAAKLVIEDNFGIRLRNGAEGIHQAQTFIQDVGPQALLNRKGSP